MHFVFATRGVKHARDVFVTQAQGLKFNWEREEKQPDGTYKKVKKIYWGQLRPIELWEYIFPEEYKDEVLTAFNCAEDGEVHPLAAKINRKVLQKVMGLKPVKYKKVKNLEMGMVLPRSLVGGDDGVALYPIGLKEDVKGEWKELGIKQEML